MLLDVLTKYHNITRIERLMLDVKSERSIGNPNSTFTLYTGTKYCRQRLGGDDEASDEELVGILCKAEFVLVRQNNVGSDISEEPRG